MDWRQKIIAVLALCVVTLLGYVVPTTTIFEKNQQVTQVAPNEDSARKVSLDINADDIQAQSVLVIDFTNDRVLYEKNALTVRPLASLVKLFVILHALEQDIYNNTLVTVSPEAILQTGDIGLRAGETWSINDVIDMMLIASSNDAAYALFETFENKTPQRFFLDTLQEFSWSIGADTFFARSATGLDDDNGATTYGSAWDVMHAIKYGWRHYPRIFSESSITNKTYQRFDTEFTIENTNVLLNDVPNIIFSKTGYTAVAGGNLAIILEAAPHHRVGIVVLGSTFDGRFEDVRTIIQELTNTFATLSNA